MSIQNNQVIPGAPVVAPTGFRPTTTAAVGQAPVKTTSEDRSAVAAKPDVAINLRQAAADVEKQYRAAGRNLQFQIDDGTGLVVVRVVDADSGDVIRQIPNEEFLRLARNIRSQESHVNFIVDERA